MIGANRVYQLFMISYSPVNWERREKQWNGNFVLSAVPVQAVAQAGHSKVINCAMFAALHWSCRLAACQNQTDQPSACILICLLYFNCWDALSLPPPCSSEVQKLQETAGQKRPFHKHHTTHRNLLGLGKFMGLQVPEIFMSIFWVFVPLMLHLLFSNEGFLINCRHDIFIYNCNCLITGFLYLWKWALNLLYNFQQVYFESQKWNLFLMKLYFKMLLPVMRNRCLTAKTGCGMV